MIGCRLSLQSPAAELRREFRVCARRADSGGFPQLQRAGPGMAWRLLRHEKRTLSPRKRTDSVEGKVLEGKRAPMAAHGKQYSIRAAILLWIALAAAFWCAIFLIVAAVTR
jgi:hypothetical protein